MPFAAALFASALALAAPLNPGGQLEAQALLASQGTGAVHAVVPSTTDQDPSDPAPTAAQQLKAGATSSALLTLGVAESAELRGTLDAPALQQVRSRGAVPLMAAGGALFIAGLLIGDDLGTLLAVGGAVLGSYGVYLYF